MTYSEDKYKYNLDSLIQIILSIVFISALFLPSFRLTSSFAIRLDDLFLLGLSPLIFILVLSIRQKLFNLNKYLLIYCVLISFIFFSCLYGYLFLSVPFSGGDINEIVRLLKLFFVISLVSFVNIDSFERNLNKMVIAGSVYIILLGCVQYLNPMGLGDLLAKMYGEHHAETMIESSNESRRVILSGAGPNDGALIALLLYIYMIFLFIKRQKSKYLILCVGLFVCILFTSSRTTLLATALVTSLILLRYGSYLSKIVFASVIALVLIYILPYFEYIYLGFQMALEGTNTSMLKRFEKWEDAFELFKQSKLLGWGIAKSIHITVVDSEYFLSLRRYGIIGAILLLAFIHYPFLSKVKNNTMIKSVVKYIALASIVIMITSNFFNSYQTITVYVMLVAVCEREFKSNQTASDYSS